MAAKSKNPAKDGSSKQAKTATPSAKAKKSKGKVLTDKELLARVKAQGLAQQWAAEDDEQEERRVRNKKNASRRAPTPTIQFEDDSDDASNNEDSQSSDHSQDEQQHDDVDQEDEDYDEDEDAEAAELEPQQATKKKGKATKRARREPESESEERPKKKHRRGAEVPEIEIRSSRPITRPLPQPRSSTSRPPAPPAPAAQGTDAPATAATPAAPTAPEPPSTPQRPAIHAAPAPCTPYVCVPNPGRRHETTENLLTPTTSDVFDIVKPQFLVHVLTQNAFPTLKEAITAVKPMIVEASKTGQANTKKRYLRIADKTFVTDLVKLAFGRASALRSHMVKTAKRLVIEHHKLDTFKKTKDRRAAVKKLLRKHAFVHEDPADLKSGMFQHPALRALIVQALFTSSLPGYNLGCSDAYTDAFDPIPLPLIALASVTLQCALEQWKSGKFTPIQFKADFYRGKYTKLKGKLDDFFSSEDVAEIFAEERAEWYKTAMESCGAYDSDEEDPSRDEDDDDLIALNQAALKAKRAAAERMAATAAAATATATSATAAAAPAGSASGSAGDG